VKARGTEWTFGWIGWNQRPVPDAPFFKDKRVRMAMTYALNHKDLLDELYFNLYEPAMCPFHPDSWMHAASNQPFQQDLDKAEELLDEAGWTDSDADGVRDQTVDGKKWKFEFTMTIPVGGTGEQVAVLLKEDLDSIGVRMDIKQLEWATFSSATHEHRFQANIQAWGTGTDPDTAKNIWKSDMYENGRNYVGYANPRVDALFDQGARELDFEKRKLIYQEIDRLIHEDQPYTFLTYRTTLWAFGTRLRGYQFSPRYVYNYSPGFYSLWIAKNAGS
jgi:peptide/nickel transport system substrate-binding protein